MRQLQISRTDLRVVRVVDVDEPPLADGAARLRLELFALTSNNITYATMGEGALGYWDFFPAPEGWGRPPAWGFATVAASRAPGVEIGARYYGYFPIGETLDVHPIKVGPRGFVDGAPHRAPKAAIYNLYNDVAADPAYVIGFEPEQALFRPLYATGWWAADCVHQGGQACVVMSSASAKTAMATAHRLRRLGGAELIGLTSARNLAYVAGTGLYDRTVAYDDVETLAVPEPAVFVDFLGRDQLIRLVHAALGATLTRSVLIGATDWTDKPGGIQPPTLPIVGPQPEFFFVPSYAAGRLTTDATLGAAMLSDLRGFYDASRALVTAQRHQGWDAVLDAWDRLAGGAVAPGDGLVLSP